MKFVILHMAVNGAQAYVPPDAVFYLIRNKVEDGTEYTRVVLKGDVDRFFDVIEKVEQVARMLADAS